MRSFEFMGHTADVRVKIRGSTVQELFEAGLLAMAEIIRPGGCNEAGGPEETRSLHITTVDRTALLVDFLSDVLTLSHSEGLLFCRTEISVLTECELVVSVFGRRVDGWDEDIKAVTYHEADVRKLVDGTWETMVIFDI
jgi:SHS2 domain-containing protein